MDGQLLIEASSTFLGRQRAMDAGQLDLSCLSLEFQGKILRNAAL